MFNNKVALIIGLVILGAGLFWFIWKHLDAIRIKAEIESRLNQRLKKLNYEAPESPEYAEKWIVDTNGEIIGGTYIKKYGWDFTSIKTGVRYVGKDE